MAIQPQAATYNAYTDPNRKNQVYPTGKQVGTTAATNQKTTTVAGTPPTNSPTTANASPNTAAGAAAGKTSPSYAPINNPAQNIVSSVPGGKDLNELLYLKKLYEGPNASKGQQSWASGQAGQYYGNLDPAVASQVKGMNAQQLNDYILGLQGKQGVGASTGGTPSVAAGPSATDLINQQYELGVKNLQAGAYDARNQADAMNLQNARGLQEIMNNQGLGASGENITATLQQNAQRQGAITDINNQLSQNINQLDIQRAKQLQDQFNMDEDRALQVAQLMGSYKGNNTLAKTAQDYDIFDRNRAYDRGVLVDDRNYNRDVFTQDRAYNRDVLTGDRNYNLDVDRFNFDKANTLFNQNMQQKEFAANNAYRNASLARSRAGGGGSSGGSGVEAGKPASFSQMSKFKNDLADRYTSYSNVDGVGKSTVTNPNALMAAIDSLGLNDDQTEELYRNFNLVSGGGGGFFTNFLTKLFTPK